MKVQLVRVNDAFHFEGSGSSEVKVHTDGSPEIGGSNLGVRPMELLLLGLASCSAIDVVLILKKQRQDITDFRISAEGDREQRKIPSENLSVKFISFSNLPATSLTRIRSTVLSPCPWRNIAPQQRSWKHWLRLPIVSKLLLYKIESGF